MNAPITLRTRVFHLALIAVAGLGIAAPASAQTLKVLTAGAFKQVVVALVPALEAKTGMKIEVDNDTAGALVRKVQAGEPFDVLVLPPNGLATLGKEGLVDAGNIQPVARVGIGVAVKAGSPRPALATVEHFKEAVLRARKVAYIDPASGGSSGAVGPLPEGIQNYTTYAAGVSAKSRCAAAARVLLQTLTSPEAVEVIRAKGMTAAP